MLSPAIAASLLLLSIVTTVHACLHGIVQPRNIIQRRVEPPIAVSRNNTRPTPKRIAIKNVKVFDGTNVLAPSTVIIDGERIGIDDGTTVDEYVDGNGGTLLPGLFDAHLHAHSITDLEILASYGVTTALVMSCFPESYCNSLRGQVGLTDFYAPGDPANSPNSSHTVNIAGFPQDQLIRKPSDADWFVANRVGNGSAYIKLIAEADGMTQAEHNALVVKAHQCGLKVTTHTSTHQDYNTAIASGTDVIQHVFADLAITDSQVHEIRARRMAVTSTLSVAQLYVDKLHPPGWTLATAMENCTNSTSDGAHYALSLPMGSSLHHELELLSRAGLPTVDILRAATSRSAKQFGFEDRGVIEPGRRADLVLIQGDPITNISNTRNIKRVWLSGIEYPEVAKS